MYRWAALVVVACAVAASPAAATPVAIKVLDVDVAISQGHTQFIGQIGDDCVNLSSNGWNDLGTRHRIEYEGGSDAQGTYDGVAHAGQVLGTAPALSLTGTVLGAFGRPYDNVVDINDVGMEAAGGRVYLTARLVARKELLYSAARRVRIAVIARPTFFAGPETVPRHPSKTIPNTFVMAVQGRATVMPALSAAVWRLRCLHKNNRFVHPHRVKPGAPLGLVTVQLQPQAAVATAGTVDVIDGPQLTTDQGDVQVEPIAPAVRVTTGETSGLRFPFADGLHLELTCDGGANCEAAGGTPALAGGFTASTGGRTATVDALQLSYRGSSIGLGGAVNGRPVTLVTPGDRLFTDEALAALSDALGTQVIQGYLQDIEDTFTQTIPF
jgi:hypothetical protein